MAGNSYQGQGRNSSDPAAGWGDPRGCIRSSWTLDWTCVHDGHIVLGHGCCIAPDRGCCIAPEHERCIGPGHGRYIAPGHERGIAPDRGCYIVLHHEGGIAPDQGTCFHPRATTAGL